MKLLFLTLLVVVAYAGSKVQLSELNGQWITLGILADNPEKIQVGGPLRFLLRHIEITGDGLALTATFDIQKTGTCQKYKVKGVRNESGMYEAQYSGINYYVILWADQDFSVFYIVNVDEKGQITELILLAGRVPRSSPLPEKKLEELAKEKGIPFSSLECIPYPDPCFV